jgi:hypothetical protein
VRSKTRWTPRSSSGSDVSSSAATTGPGATGAHWTSSASSDAFPQMPQLDVV